MWLERGILYMVVELSASAVRDSDGVRVVSDSEYIPYLNQWVRDYVDKRSVTDEMVVLVAEVDMDESDVVALTINELCASERAEREAERVDTIRVEAL